MLISFFSDIINLLITIKIRKAPTSLKKMNIKDSFYRFLRNTTQTENFFELYFLFI